MLGSSTVSPANHRNYACFSRPAYCNPEKLLLTHMMAIYTGLKLLGTWQHLSQVTLETCHPEPLQVFWMNFADLQHDWLT